MGTTIAVVIVRPATDRVRILRERSGHPQEHEHAMRIDSASGARLSRWLYAQAHKDGGSVEIDNLAGAWAYYVKA